MEMEFKRIVKKEVEETVRLELRKFWLVRVISDTAAKSCITEKEFHYVPEEQEIADTLAPYINRKCFAVVETRYTFVEALHSIDQLEEVPI